MKKKTDNAAYMKRWTEDRKEEWGDYYFLFRKHSQLKKFGLTGNDYLVMWMECGGLCEVCGRADADRLLAVDHCHETGRVRGLLCLNCNQALGKLKDDPELIRSLAEYAEAR